MEKNTKLLPRSISLYERTLRRFLDIYPDARVDDINAFVSESFRDKRSVYVKYAFKYFLEFQGRKKDYPKIVQVRTKPRVKKGIYISSGEIWKIINNIRDEKYRMVAIIQHLTGARPHDVLSIGRMDLMIDRRGAWLKMGVKGDKEDVKPIPDNHIKQIVAFFKVADEYPFLRGHSKDFVILVNNNYQYYYTALKEAAARAGHPAFNPHDFRRNFGNDVFRKTSNIVAVKDMLGHSRVETTMSYLDTIPKAAAKKITDSIRGD